MRNSRPRPQNDGIDKLSELDGGGVMNERPQYVTITRTQTPRTSTSDAEDGEIVDDDQYAAHEDGDAYVQPIRVSSTTPQPTHSYVNIRRSRPATPATERESSIDTADEDDKQTTRMQYVSIKRTRPSQQPGTNEEIVDATPESK